MIRPLTLSSLLLVFASSAAAQLPVVELKTLTPCGGQAGDAVDVAVNATEADGIDRLLFSHPGIQAKQATRPSAVFDGQSEPVDNRFVVTIAADVPPGLYDVRAAGAMGVSNPLTFAVDRWKESLEPAGNQSFEKAAPLDVGTVVNGAVAANTEDWFRFRGQKGARIIIDVLGQRIDSKIDATLVVYDSTRRELARSRDVNRRDPLVDLVIPADGDYFINLYDFTYGGGSDFFYRLALHQGSYVDFVYPPFVRLGAKNKLAVYGRNLPGGKPAPEAVVFGRPLERLDVEIDVPADESADRLTAPGYFDAAQSFIDGREYRLKTSSGPSNSVVLNCVSNTVVLEQEPNDGSDAKGGEQNQPVTVPCEIAGQFLRRGDLDCFAFDAKKGEAVSIEITAQRLGLKTDPVLLLQQANKSADGKTAWGDLKEIDDEGKAPPGVKLSLNSNDASYIFTAPADGRFRVLVRDLYGDTRGEARLIYRLSLRKPTPDFRLAAHAYPLAGSKDNNDGRKYGPAGSLLRAGETSMLTVLAERRDGFTGPVSLRVEGLPAGVVASPAVIAAGQNAATLSLTAAESVADWQGSIRVVGEGNADALKLKHEARTVVFTTPAPTNNQSAEGRVARDYALAVNGAEKMPLTIQLGDGKIPETARGQKLEVPIKLVRRADFKDEVLLTAAGLPAGVKAATVKVAGDAQEAKLTLETAANAPLGEFGFYLAAQAKLNYVRDKRSAESAAQRKQAIEKVVAEQRAALEAAKKAAAAADKVKKPAADKAVAETAAKLQAAEAALKTAQASADAKQKAVAPRSIANVPLTSSNLVVRLVEPPKPVDSKKPAK